MVETSYTYLLSCGVHVGHSLRNSHRLCGWMVLAQRQEVLLIDLSKFLYMLSKALLLVQEAVRLRHPIGFISLDGMKASIVRKASKLCGEYHVSALGIGGLITNFLAISSASGWRYNYRSPIVHSAKQLLRREIYDDGLLTRLTWPRAIFLCGVRLSYRVAKEALRAQIPCIGIADTATAAHTLSLAVPGNDTSLEASFFYNSLLANTILLKKFSSVFLWAANVRQTNRLGSFSRGFAFYSSSRLRDLHSRPAKSLWSGYPFLQGVPSSSSLTTASMMSRLMASSLAVARSLSQGQETLALDSASTFTLVLPQVAQFFSHHRERFNGLLTLHFLASRRQLLQRRIKRGFLAFSRKRPINYSHPKSTFIFRHNYLDLMGPSYRSLERDYVYKRALDCSPFFHYRNRSLERIFFKILSALFLLSSYNQRLPLQSSKAALNPFSYFWRSPFRRRVRRQCPKPPHFFKQVLYFFLARALHLNIFLSPSYKLPWLKSSRFSPSGASRPRRWRRPQAKSWLRSSRFSPSGASRPRRWRRPQAKSRLKSSRFSPKSRILLALRRRRRIARVKSESIMFPQRTQVSPRAFTMFLLNRWQFEQSLVPQLYWQFRLLHLPSQGDLPISLENKNSQRSRKQSMLPSYGLLRESVLWLRRRRDHPSFVNSNSTTDGIEEPCFP